MLTPCSYNTALFWCNIRCLFTFRKLSNRQISTNTPNHALKGCAVSYDKISFMALVPCCVSSIPIVLYFFKICSESESSSAALSLSPSSTPLPTSSFTLTSSLGGTGSTGSCRFGSRNSSLSLANSKIKIETQSSNKSVR